MTDANVKVRIGETLYVSDREIIRRAGLPINRAYQIFKDLDKDPSRSGFPQKIKLWGNRRYWPAVKAYFDRTSGFTLATSANQRGRHD